MTLTGRAALAALLGGLVVLAFGTTTALLVVNAVIAVVIAADLVLAASLRKLAVGRSGDAKIHLGESGVVHLSVANHGSRQLKGSVRDGWRPSAGATPTRVQVRVLAGRGMTLATTLTPRRRGDLAAGLVTIRSLGPFGLAG